MIRRQTSHVSDVQKSESMRLPEDLPYERCIYQNLYTTLYYCANQGASFALDIASLG